MSEDFLHYIWKFQLFNPINFVLSNEDTMFVQKVGEHNSNAGPDFLNSKIKINDLEWVGNVEIHIKSSDWNKHNHQADRKYDNVILHVVWENDEQIFRKDNTPIPTLEIKELIKSEAVTNYNSLMGSLSNISCEQFIKSISPIVLHSAKERAVIDRLELKSNTFKGRLIELNNDWEQLTFEVIALTFGLKVNADNFTQLAQNTPIKTLQKHKGNLNQIEALLFGQAAYLKEEGIQDEYYKGLKKEYNFLKQKYSLETPLQSHSWNLLRLRPASFPTLRIALLASLVNNTSSLFSLFIENKSIIEITKVLSSKASEYWDTHYVFDKKSDKELVKKISKSLVELLIINAIIPILYLYGLKKNSQEHINRCIELLEQLKPEKNKKTALWYEIGVEIKTAFDSQALIQLYNNSCKTKSCLNCTIGSTILDKI